MASEIGTATVHVIPNVIPDIPRIQILELPMEHEGTYSHTPFAIVIDGVGAEDRDDIEAVAPGMKELLGAKGVLIFPGRVAIG